jgi:branched-chain amino acid transport system permease protein
MLGAYLRAATENPKLVQGFGINVPLLVSGAYGFGVFLAAFSGVLAVPIYLASPSMSGNVIVVVFAVVVIGGMGSLGGAIISGFALGLIEGLTKVFYPEAASTMIFLLMVAVLLWKPSGLFGALRMEATPVVFSSTSFRASELPRPIVLAAIAAVVIVAPAFAYPVFLMKVLCFALFASAFNLLHGYLGLLSFGHAAFFGWSAYVTAYAIKEGNFSPEVAVLLGVGFATLLGLVGGIIAIRRKGIYFAMVTLALAQTMYFIAASSEFTHREDGIQAVPRGVLFSFIDLDSNYTLYYVVLLIVVFGIAVIYRVIQTRHKCTLLLFILPAPGADQFGIT